MESGRSLQCRISPTLGAWVIQDNIPISVVAQGAPVPPELLDVIKCQCKAQGKQCSTEASSCHKQHLACTSYCNCSAWYDCCNLYSVGQSTQTEEARESIDAEDEDYEKDAAIEDVVEEEPVDFADPEFELEEF